MQPLVSIVIPCFNAERTIGATIRSALAQTYQPIEVIVIDDGSQDRSLAIVKSFGDTVRVEAQTNSGACAARNRGIELARGEYVQFLDADDLLHWGKVARQMAARGDDNKILFGPWLAFAGDAPAEPYVADIRCVRSTDELLLQYLQGMFVATSALLWPTKLLARIGGWDTLLNANQDGEILMRAMHASAQLQYCDSAWSFYRRATAGDANISARTNAKAHRSRLRVLRRMYRWNVTETTSRQVLMRFWEKYLYLGSALAGIDRRHSQLAYRLARRARKQAGGGIGDPTRLFGYLAQKLDCARDSWSQQTLSRVIRAYRRVCA
jgi:glycosyltransferase involved in cell wall biosynthesis